MVQNNKTIFRSILGFALVISVAGSLHAEEITYDSGKRRDPFVPLSGEDSSLVLASTSGVKLEGVIYDPNGKSMAILNGKTYSAGESVGDATVVKIQKDHVVILVEEEEQTLRIREEEKS